jgi:hypothetical protein
MSRPKVAISTRLIKQDSTGKALLFRPYLVSEEKILMEAKQSREVKEIFRAVKDVISACCLEDDFDVDTIPNCDVTTLFLRLRAASVNSAEKFIITDDEDEKQHMEVVDFNAIFTKFS